MNEKRVFPYVTKYRCSSFCHEGMLYAREYVCHYIFYYLNYSKDADASASFFFIVEQGAISFSFLDHGRCISASLERIVAASKFAAVPKKRRNICLL